MESTLITGIGGAVTCSSYADCTQDSLLPAAYHQRAWKAGGDQRQLHAKTVIPSAGWQNRAAAISVPEIAAAFSIPY
jgi:hypothetical protein